VGASAGARIRRGLWVALRAGASDWMPDRTDTGQEKNAPTTRASNPNGPGGRPSCGPRETYGLLSRRRHYGGC